MRRLKDSGTLISKGSISLVLRTLGKRFSSKYLEKWLQINYRLTGHKAPFLNTEEEEALKKGFRATVAGYFYAVPDSIKRKHLPFYDYIIMRLLEFIGRTELYVYFRVLKTKSCNAKMNKYWEYICKFNNWQYVPETGVPVHIQLGNRPVPGQVVLEPLRRFSNPRIANHVRRQANAHRRGKARAPV